MSAFNTLYHGTPDDAADLLDGDNPTKDPDDLRAALTNALRRIGQLERSLDLASKILDKVVGSSANPTGDSK